MTTTPSDSTPAPVLATGERISGFRILRVEAIPEIRVTAYECEHERTGAKAVLLHSPDRENLYSIGFRTPVGDSTGVPHILEHAVLAGSERYPLKDVFSELHRGSLQTFINAMTYPDKTLYPVASQVRADFFNLARVYTDLVLRPRLLAETFAQEGHHLEFLDETGTGPLTVNGIVYSEMKGAYSSPDGIMFKAIQEALFPESTYAFDSGGDPEVIPTLSYEQFTDFHRRYYSPSNARFFIYGDIDPRDHLAFLEEMLAGFDRIAVDSTVPSQPRWKAPSSVHTLYPVGPDEPLERRAIVTVAWMTAENTDSEAALLLECVAALLVGSAAAPLRKALIDSGLGEDISPATGLERDFKQIVFAAGLRGTEPDRAERIEALVLDTLAACAAQGFDRDLVEGVLHRAEFHGREIVRNGYPYGMMLMGRAYHTWLYDGDPFRNLNAARLIGALRERWARSPSLFQDAVRTWLLDNPHRLLAVMEPSRTVAGEREEAFRRKMSTLRESLLPAACEEIRRRTDLLRKFQTEPDSPAAAASLPRLSRSDIPPDIETIPTERGEIAGVPALVHPLFANGIAYADVAFDVAAVPEELQFHLPLLGKLICNMGAAGLTYDEMAKRIALKTGGVSCHLSAGLQADGRGSWQKIVFRVKALHRNLAEAVRILMDLLLAGDLEDRRRMRDQVAEAKNRLHAAVVPSGHLFARRSAGASLSLPGHRDEQWHGRAQLRFVTRLAEEFAAGDDLAERIADLKTLLFRRSGLTVNLTGDEEALAILRREMESLVRSCAEGGPGTAAVPSLRPASGLGVAIPAQVSYVAQVMAAPTYGDPRAASLFVAARHLSSGYLYRHIRVQGGAYGGMATYDLPGGLFAFLSYRDPRLTETLQVYRDAVRDLAEHGITEEELDKAVLGSIAALDKPSDPAGKGYAALLREFAGVTDEMRQAFRRAILDMTPAAMAERVVPFLTEAAASAAVAVYADGEKLAEANKTLRPELAVAPLVP